MRKNRKRVCALLLSGVMLLTQLPMAALAAEAIPEDKVNFAAGEREDALGHGAIASFEPLDSGIAEQTVPVGRSLSELDLPDALAAAVYRVSEDTLVTEDGTPGNDVGQEKDSGNIVTTVTTTEEQIPVTWDSAPAYDGDTPDKYVFTADVGSYDLADDVEPPRITVTVAAPCAKTEGCTLADRHEGDCVTPPPADNGLTKTITSWTFADGNLNMGELPLGGVSTDNPIDFDTVVSMLPTQISAEIEDEEEPAIVDITGWSCDTFTQGTDGNWPLTGEYTFTTEPETGYVLASEAAALKIKVLLGGANTYAQNNTVEQGGIKIVASNGGEVAYTEGNGFTLAKDGTYVISGTWNGTLNASYGNPKTVITVESGVTANVTFSGVDINVSGTRSACAFAIAPGGEANVTLADGSGNILKSGDYHAGLEAPDGSTLEIDGSGTLEATGNDGAGIGGGYRSSSPNGGNITINGGMVTATGTGGGAGIGGFGDGGKITISGGTVTAEGGGGAGIGGGSDGDGGEIIISGGTVTATSNGGYGAGIGGGYGGFGGDGGKITISGGTVTAEGGYGAGIGGGGGGDGYGGGGDGGEIIISGGTVTATSNGGYGAGIGGGYGGSVPGDGGKITISGGTVTAEGGYGAGIGGGGDGGYGAGFGGSGGNVKISGVDTIVKAKSENGYDVGGGTGSISSGDDGSLSVTDGATLEMEDKGTNVTTPEYKNCTIIDKDKNSVEYDADGKARPTLTLKVNPADSVTLPNTVTLTATLSGAIPNISGKEITFTVGGTNTTVTTDNSGEAAYTPANLSPGTYRFGAFFDGDMKNASASATDITGYTVLGTQNALTINGLSSTYTYGAAAFQLSTSGGSGSGAVSYASSDSSVASVSSNTVTIKKAGTFAITATKAAADNYAEATATSGMVTVNRATPNISLTATGGGNTSTPIVLTATVSKVNTGATPTGTVTFREGGTVLDTVNVNGSGAASYTVSNPATGSHTYTAEYSGQSDYYNGASATCTVGVGLTDQTGLSITATEIKTYGDSDFTLAATGGQSSGGVSFSAPAGNGVLTVAADGKVKITGAGSVTVTATKAADSTYNQATATLDITVNPRDISNVTVNVTGDRVYTGGQLQPTFEVSDGGLAINTGDYTNSYGPNADAGTGAGSITLTGQRNYTGTKTVTFDINKRSLTGAAITLEKTSYSYTGSAIQPAVTGVVVDKIAVAASEYDVSYANNTSAGTATVTITAKANGNFTGTASMNFTITASSGGNTGGGGSSSGDHSSYTPPATKDSYTVTGDKISQSVSRSDLKNLADAGKRLTLSCDKAGMTFDPAALKAILAAVPATAGNLTFAAAPADLSAFPDAAKLIGSRPVYDFTISYKDNKGITIKAKVDFPAGSAAITLNYSKTAAETEGSLFMVYVDGNGAVTWLDKSSYDSGKVLADAPHFSTYGIAYKAPAPVFTDTANHWAKADIEFVAARGLLSGTGNNLFSPDTPMTRGMFVTVFYRLAGSPQAAGEGGAFTDVPVDAYYADAVAWASQNKIVNGIGGGLFAPGQSVTREQMAVILANYAKAVGFELPSVYAANVFADGGQIGAWARDAVKQMQMAGVLMGKDGNRFDPQGTATRAEASAMLHRFVERMIDASTAQGWTQNDSGQWLYYMDGKPVKSQTKEIAGEKYAFDTNGVTLDYPRKKELLTYTVKAGDSFWGIARAYNVSVYTLAELNGKTIYSLIHPGDVLKIPQ